MAKLEYPTSQIVEQLTNVPISGAGDDNSCFSAVISGACHSVSEGQNAGNDLMLIGDLHGNAAITTQFNTTDQKIALDKAIFTAVGPRYVPCFGLWLGHGGWKHPIVMCCSAPRRTDFGMLPMATAATSQQLVVAVPICRQPSRIASL
jgi:hypothetical protein